MRPVRRHVVDGYEIRVYDGLLNEQDIVNLTAAFESGAFVRNEVAREDTAAFRHWALNIPMERATQLPVYKPTLDAIADFPEGDRYRVYRSYCNCSSYGDMLFTHMDSLPDQKELTALWYIAPEWDMEWGGETLFFNSRRDAEVAVSPRPGRLVVFDGHILHAGRPPNRICYMPRYTLAFKFEVPPAV